MQKYFYSEENVTPCSVTPTAVTSTNTWLGCQNALRTQNSVLSICRSGREDVPGLRDQRPSCWGGSAWQHNVWHSSWGQTYLQHSSPSISNLPFIANPNHVHRAQRRCCLNQRSVCRVSAEHRPQPGSGCQGQQPGLEKLHKPGEFLKYPWRRSHWGNTRRRS